FQKPQRAWRETVNSWRLENIDSPVSRKTNFCPLLEVLKNTLVPEIFQDGSRKCGIIPWNPDEKMSKIKKLEMGKNLLEKYIDDQKLHSFRSCDVWLGAKEDVELFKFYKRVEEPLKSLACHNSKLKANNNVPEITLQLLDDSNTDAAVNENDETRTEPSENKNESTTRTTSITDEDHLNFEKDLKIPIK
ncbi:hypothetical protein HHI36_016580, partial [Cryptolaemus montrouzieri]